LELSNKKKLERIEKQRNELQSKINKVSEQINEVDAATGVRMLVYMDYWAYIVLGIWFIIFISCAGGGAVGGAVFFLFVMINLLVIVL
jgi:hypothetical protein